MVSTYNDVFKDKDIQNHPFILALKNTNTDDNNPNSEIKCDEVFALYVKNVSHFCCPEFFKKVMKFVFLFRENVNITNKDPRYTEEKSAEDAPDSSNDFILEFLGIDSHNKYKVSKEEAIELTQNLCSWMFRNSYSHSKLALC